MKLWGRSDEGLKDAWLYWIKDALQGNVAFGKNAHGRPKL
jgi:hypothetical protein